MSNNQNLIVLKRDGGLLLCLMDVAHPSSPLVESVKDLVAHALFDLFDTEFDNLLKINGTQDFQRQVTEAIVKREREFIKENESLFKQYIEENQEQLEKDKKDPYFRNRDDFKTFYRLYLLSARFTVLVKKDNQAIVLNINPINEKPEEVKEEPEVIEQKVEEKVEEVVAPVEEKKPEPEPEPEPEPQSQPEPEPVVEEKEEPQEEPVVVAPIVTPIEEEEEDNKRDIVRKSFEEKLAEADDDLRDKYYEIANEALSYGMKGRISYSADSYRLGRLTYLKITIVGKTLKVYYRLDPKAYDDTSIPHEDVHNIKAYEDIPMLFRVKSNLAVKRAKGLIADMMAPLGIERQKLSDEQKLGVVKGFGKFEVYPEEDEFKYRLKANNGEILVVSFGYASRDGAHNGIETLRKNLEVGVASFITDKNGYSQWRLSTANDVRLVALGELYPSIDGAERSFESVKRFANTEAIIDLEEIPNDERREWRIGFARQENKENGKIEIFSEEGSEKIKARLLASNGEILMLTANNYASKSSCLDAIDNIKEKINEKSFNILKDKAERFRFVLEGGSGTLLALGETYASKDSARSAAESALSFINLAEIVDLTKGDNGEEEKEEKEIEPQPEPVLEEKEPEPVEEVEEEEEEVKLDENGFPNIVKRTFYEKLMRSRNETRHAYKEIKDYGVETYGLTSRVSSNADSLSYKRKNYVKLQIFGKTLKIHYRLDPKEYSESPIPVEDDSNKAIYTELPLAFKVKSDLAMRRAKKLIDEAMKQAGIEKIKK